MKISVYVKKKGKSNISQIPKQGIWVSPEKHTSKQVTHHDCLPSLLGDGDKGMEIVGPLEQPRENKNLLNRHDKPNEPTKKRPLHLSSLSPHSPKFQPERRGEGQVERTGRIISLHSIPYKQRILSNWILPRT